MIKRILIGLILLSLVAATGLAFHVRDQLTTPLAIDEPTLYQVASGASVRSVLAEFESRGWVEQARLLELWLRYREQTAIQRGEYRLQPTETAVEAVQRMVAGEKVLRSVSFIEGWTFRQIRAALARQEHLNQTLEGLDDAQVIERLGLEIDHPEGWFFPDTYLFEGGRDDAEILRRAHEKMRAELDRAWARRADGRVVDTPYQALILASIVEKETGAASERAQIAGVFSRRLARGMRLQTDPTVIYGLGEAYDGNLTRADLRGDTPYNTYTRSGLPPTPIASPGRGALEAAVDPGDGSALFFVARGDGTHVFSDTYEEHRAAVRQYQRFGRREDYRSAPPESAEEVEP